jgi:hypothetical protein
MPRIFEKSLVVDIDLGGPFKIKGDILQQVRIDSAIILDQVCEHPADFAFVAVMAVEAERQLQDAEAALKVTKNERSNAIREEFENRQEKVTEARLVSAVETDFVYLESVAKAMQARINVQTMDRICEIYEHRKFMLISAANHQRADGSGSQVTSANSRKAG